MAKTRYGSADPFRRYEEAAGIESAGIPEPAPMGPVATPLSGSVMPAYTGPRPWRGEPVQATPAPMPQRSLLGRAADYISGKSVFKSVAPRSPAAETRGLLASEPTLASSRLMPLSSIPRKKMLDRSTMGSPPFSKKELAQGYRKVGKGK